MATTKDATETDKPEEPRVLRWDEQMAETMRQRARDRADRRKART